jgi:2-polyprenyl-3-methyl-5-hydroxy-6-metoxy-1,4-benzoquinol methylase
MTRLIPRQLTRNGSAYARWDALPRRAELRSPGEYRAGLRLHRELWDGGYTMLSSRRGRTLRRLAGEAVRAGVPGAVVDCGAWNGGSSLLLASGAQGRDVWVFDSFQGLPEVGPHDGAESAAFVGDCVGSEDKVRELFARHGAADRLHVRAGWFADTLERAAEEIGEIAVLHCDGDWYDSVLLTLEVLYPRVNAGGFVVIDDYGTWPGSRRATDEYRRRVGDAEPLHRVDHTGRWWRKRQPRAASAAAAPPVTDEAVTVRVNAEGSDPDLDVDRTWSAQHATIPWLETVVPLAGARVLEYGCGDGQVSRAFAPHVASVLGLDIDAGAVERGRRELEALGVANVTLEAHPVERIVGRMRELAGEIDVVLLYAVVEHLSIAERLEVLSAAREVARPDGVIVVIETPNRLVSFDHHSSQMPYMSWLPYELGRRYGERSARADFAERLRAADGADDAELREWWIRFGRGASFHEFELVFGDLSRHVLAGGYDTVMWPARPLLPPELPLARDLERERPDLGPMWSRSWLDLVLAPDPQDEPRTFVRPWSFDTRESDDVGLTRWGALELPGPQAVLRARPGSPSRRLVAGFMAAPGEVVLTVVADGRTVATVPTTADVLYRWRFVDVTWERPAELVELRSSAGAQIQLVAFEH